MKICFSDSVSFKIYSLTCFSLNNCLTETEYSSSIKNSISCFSSLTFKQLCATFNLCSPLVLAKRVSTTNGDSKPETECMAKINSKANNSTSEALADEEAALPSSSNSLTS